MDAPVAQVAAAEITITIGSATHPVRTHAMVAGTTRALQQAAFAAVALVAESHRAVVLLDMNRAAELAAMSNLVAVWQEVVTELAVADAELEVAVDAESHVLVSNYQVACSTRPGAALADCSASFTVA